jgi:hypothetical protein
VQILLGHTKIEGTVRYLGVDIEDALALAEGVRGKKMKCITARTMACPGSPLAKQPKMRSNPPAGKVLAGNDNACQDGTGRLATYLIRFHEAQRKIATMATAGATRIQTQIAIPMVGTPPSTHHCVKRLTIASCELFLQRRAKNKREIFGMMVSRCAHERAAAASRAD